MNRFYLFLYIIWSSKENCIFLKETDEGIPIIDSEKLRTRTTSKMSQKQEILHNLHKGMKAKAIMKKYGIGKSTITGIKNESA